MALIPSHMPRMGSMPERVDALAWYRPDAPGLMDMRYQARDGVVNLRYPSKDGQLFGVPRTLAPDNPVNDHRSIGDFTFEAAFTSKLRPEQVPFVDGVFSAMENELGCIGEAPTGFGKTVTGCALACRIGRPTCIIIPKGDLDWTETLLEHTTIPESKIDKWQGQRLPREDAWIVIAMLQSIYRDFVYPQHVYDRFACVIVDEVHRVGSEEFSKTLRKFPAMWRLGLSATADRRDGKMDLIRSHIGWRHVVGHSDAETPLYFYVPSGWSPDGSDFNPSRTDKTKRQLMADPLRNGIIAEAARRASVKGRRTIVFVEQVKHQNRLRDALRGCGVPSGLIARYGGDGTKEEAEMAKACPPGLVMLATYKYTAEGTNIPALDTAIIAHPIYDPRQAVGRILRKLDGKPRPVVVDIWDDSPALQRIAKARWKYLRDNGAVWKGVFR